MFVMMIFFFFQAEDGIRDLTVTGVQTCALPISTGQAAKYISRHPKTLQAMDRAGVVPARRTASGRRYWLRSEEHTSEFQSQSNLVCRLLLENKTRTRCLTFTSQLLAR